MVGLSGNCTVTCRCPLFGYEAASRSSARFVAKGPGRLYIPRAMVDGGRGGGGGGRQPLKMAAMAGGGVEFAVAICVGVFGGRWLDLHFGTSPWLTIAGTFVGAGGGFYRLYRAMMAGDTPRRPD
jgi:hypothetical protein